MASSDRPVALITGSTRGIGFGIAAGLSARGFDVVLNGRDAKRLDSARNILAAQHAGIAGGGDIYAHAFDITDADAVRGAVEEIEAEIGPIQALVNNAGTVAREPLLDTTLDAWSATLDANATGAFIVSTSVAPRMLERGRGKIVNIGSVQSRVARRGLGSYAASKSALSSLTRTMCVEWGPHGIQANALAPGYIETDMNRGLHDDPAFSDWLTARTPAGRWGRIQDVVGPTLWLCSEHSDFVNGQIIHVDGGITAAI
jgi:gluconate 5-dehydrogenase